MYSSILIEIVTAIGRFIFNPLLYIAIGAAIFLGYKRVKQERKFFNTRIVWGWTELRGFWKNGLVYALIISIISVAAGLTVPKAFLILCILVSIVVLLFNFLSPVYVMAGSTLLVWLMYKNEWTYSFWKVSLQGMDLLNGAIVTITILTGLIVIAEGLLVKKSAVDVTSPRIEQTKRGMRAIVYRTKKLWLLPIIFVIPGERIVASSPYWPHFDLGESTYALVLFPVVIGFSKLSRKTLPVVQIPKMGRAILLLGQLVLVGGLVSYFVPVIGFVALGIGVVIRFGISLYFALQDKSEVYAVAQSSQGAVIAAVLPDSPAEKMGLLAGECIRKVNGQSVRTERELYEALQINAAHCRLEVLDRNQELRLTQHVIYSNDHHRVGLLLAEMRES
ncbi:MAG: PDZ domain-containing protein [Lysinibacillus sp.]